MKLSVILAEVSTLIDISERSHLCRILGVPETASNDWYLKSADRFDLISQRAPNVSVPVDAQNKFLCQELRALYKAYDKLGDDTTVIAGGSDGVDTAAQRNRLRIAIMIYNRVFPSNDLVPNEDIFSAMSELRDSVGGDSGNIMHIPIRYNEQCSDSEY